MESKYLPLLNFPSSEIPRPELSFLVVHFNTHGIEGRKKKEPARRGPRLSETNEEYSKKSEKRASLRTFLFRFRGNAHTRAEDK